MTLDLPSLPAPDPTPNRLKAAFPPEIEGAREFRGQPCVQARRGRILEILRFLRDDPDLAYDMLTDLSAVDLSGLDGEERFAVVYQLYSFKNNRWFRLKALVPEAEPEIDSAAALWPSANWLERECFDMFGIRFRGHPDLRRILMPDDYEGYPLRRDYPLRGRGERASFARYEG